VLFALGLVTGTLSVPSLMAMLSFLLPPDDFSVAIALMIAVIGQPAVFLVISAILTWRRAPLRFVAWGATAGSFFAIVAVFVVGFLNMPIVPGWG
jgi:uncharacterized paraquat-inducible protein A